MKIQRRTVVACASVGAMSLAVVVALALGPMEGRVSLFVAGLVAIAMSVSSVVADPRELLVALVLGAAPVMALVAQGASVWMIGPLAVLLLVGGELNALKWELGRSESVGVDVRRRAGIIARLAALGLATSLAAGLAAQWTLFSAPATVWVAAAAIAGLAWMVFPGPGRHPSDPSSR